MGMIIYVLTNTVNGKQYVGKTKLTAQKRFNTHIRDSKAGSELALHRAIRKHGSDAFLVEQVDTALDKEELKEKERMWVTKLNTFGEGYNMTPGGDGHGHKLSEETKEKIQKSRIQYFQEHPEARTKAVEYAKMATLSDEGRQAMRQKHTGRKHRPEAIEKMSKAKTQYFIDHPEGREIISRTHTGKIVSSKTRDKIAMARNS